MESSLTKQLPTQLQLLQMFDFNFETGDVRWKVSRGGCNPGERAGYQHSSGYNLIMIDRKNYRLHRIIFVAFYGDILQCDDIVDHIDQDKTNNTISNLRLVTKVANCQNKQIHKIKPYGVYEYVECGKTKWGVTIRKTKADVVKHDNDSVIAFRKNGFKSCRDAYVVARDEHKRIRGNYPLNDRMWCERLGISYF